ncbi:hypothetical protein [Mycobacterium sp. 3519A]|jgi:hypothetical protein|uniref:hypothetical protein n=1 Tax=Mycobacterium sp. 3519A TaxID=2057184 RepID=UPI000C797D58|nr:hypothetical protein [Mycobacterium sp. 3519A]
MDPKDRIPHDDWADQDLLTKSEAAERLAAEIEDVQTKLAAGAGDEIMERRLGALRESLARITSAD